MTRRRLLLFVVLLLVPSLARAGIRLDTDEPPPDFANRRIWFLRGGHGPCVVFIHALGGDDSEFSVDGTRLTASHEVLVVDLPGHGRSKVPPLPIHVDDMAAQVAGLMREQGCAPAVVVGHSMGGIVAAHLAVVDPGLVRALVVVDSVIGKFPVSAKERDTLLANLKRDRRGTLTKFYTPMASGKAQVKKLVDVAMTVDPRVFVGLLWAGANEPLGDRAPKIRVPTLLMESTELIDHKAPPADHLAQLGFTMPNVTVEEFPASKHWLMWDEPAHFAKALDDFLKKVE